MNIAIAGTGYVGLVTGVCLAEIGYQVTCIDIDESKIETMKQGKSPIYESGLEELILKEVYEGFHQPLVCTDRYSAEMIKYASNDFLALKVSYINEIANFCEIVGANVEDVA